MRILLIILTAILVKTNSNSLKDGAELFLKSYYSANAELKFEKFIIPHDVKRRVESSAGQKFYKEFVYLWRVYEKDELMSVAILDNVNGKSLPITFLTIFDINGNIITVEVLKYREPYGGQVTEKGWLKQFSNKNSGNNFDVGKDISTISGATISVNSVTKGIKKLTLLFHEIKKVL